MAQSIAIGRGTSVTLATTVLRILPLNRAQTGTGYPRKLVLLETTVDTYLVTAREATDGGALPSTYVPLDALDRLVEYDISGASFLGLAGLSAGTCRIELR